MDVDVVIVAYRSSAHLRPCVEQLCHEADLHVIVMDNACPERSAETVKDLPIQTVAIGENVGFAAGSNAGAKRGHSEAILFLNPDAVMGPDDVRALARQLTLHPDCAAVGPRIFDPGGSLRLSMRRLPRLRSAFGEALFLHHFFRRARWATEFVRSGYGAPAYAEWLSGAALCVRRRAFEAIGGFDERFFLYSEDTDLGKRLCEAGLRLRYEPSATAVHVGAASAPGPGQAALKLRARLLYARIHERGARYFGFRIAYALHECLRIPLAAARSRLDLQARLQALRIALRPVPVLRRAPFSG